LYFDRTASSIPLLIGFNGKNNGLSAEPGFESCILRLCLVPGNKRKQAVVPVTKNTENQGEKANQVQGKPFWVSVCRQAAVDSGLLSKLKKTVSRKESHNFPRNNKIRIRLLLKLKRVNGFRAKMKNPEICYTVSAVV